MKEAKYPEALVELRRAVALMGTNALAWNALGVVCHHTGDPTAAAAAYQEALKLDRDLVEAHFNLGCLWLEQSRLEDAKTELAAYTLRRGNVSAGWLKLASAQLRSRELTAADKSFHEALRCDSQNPEAWNGIGLIQVQRNNPRGAAQSFGTALEQQPDYGPALLNLAVVSQLSLNNPDLAIHNYRQYLALPVRPPNWQAVNATVSALEQDKSDSNGRTQAAYPGTVQSAATRARDSGPDRTVATASTGHEQPESAPAGEGKSAPRSSRSAAPPGADRPQNDKNTSSTPPPSKPNLIQRIFHSQTKEGGEAKPAPAQPNAAEAVNASANGGSQGPSTTTPGSGNRGPYIYHRVLNLEPGNRLAAEKYFLQGLQSHRAGDLSAAMRSYNQATSLDPAYFEAYYNLGLAAAAAGDAPQALSADEYALALHPDSIDARLNFAQMLKQVNYFSDAASQLATILAKAPNEPRANLALGNLCAQQFHQTAKAREHYLKVLQNDPGNPQAPAIRDWLVANPR